MTTDTSLVFKAELKSVTMTKTVSLDREYRVTLLTDDERIMTLGSIPADTIVEVTIHEVHD